MLLIYLPLTGYLRQWLTHQMGMPVVFPRASYENAVIARYISPLPAGYAPQLCRPGDVPIVVPQLHGKPADRYNYFGRRGVAALTEAVNTLFTLDLWHGVSSLISTSQLNEGIEEWCIARGIELDYREAVRQRFYRIRQNYAKHGVLLGRKNHKRTLSTGFSGSEGRGQNSFKKNR